MGLQTLFCRVNACLHVISVLHAHCVDACRKGACSSLLSLVHTVSESEAQNTSDNRTRAASWGGQRSASADVEEDVFSWDEEMTVPSLLKSSVDFNRLSLSEKLEVGFKSSGSLLKEVLLDFSPFLSRILMGSHGQELVLEGLSCQKTDSIVELVMLLCSQEWQNSLQR